MGTDALAATPLPSKPGYTGGLGVVREEGGVWDTGTAAGLGGGAKPPDAGDGLTGVLPGPVAAVCGMI
ncbi:hypothetical protein HYQ46_013104 [Verticillium longisporum]|nr:hypothetical protein HYQ46_013104 [Verticillium longisporum]